MNSQVFVAVHALLCRFFAAFDKRDWEAMSGCLAGKVFVDYLSSGREPPGFMTREAFVTNRMTAVDNLKKQHSFSNLVVKDSSNDHRVGASCNYLI
ncbi:hypothetical protein EGJ27_00105 [Pseudomonas sp. v388]|uniref:nuclear transport factor 2 family protein n=1 Tax=Pseudomonas sp. v388 TaxID=2479849 RepID=UPI000F76C74D|nr:nuclear transport factor 2 family protein [Pseudomonas sp. v388]RRV10069.1 hypothetical protein EGJ27_00105 [Pseudomonas sp. v388]